MSDKDAEISNIETKEIVLSLQHILVELEREDVEIPPSVHVMIEAELQRIWKNIGGQDVDAIYPEFMLEEGRDIETKMRPEGDSA